jgi:hypothetical protein
MAEACVPVKFLTENQRQKYGRFNQIPDETQLGGFFHLDVEARRRAMAANGAGNQLGWAVQLGTVRFLGTFLVDPTDVPAAVVEYVATQLGLEADDLKGYGEKEARWDHQAQIRQLYDYTAFGPLQWFTLARWLYTRAWLSSGERPIVLFDLATPPPGAAPDSAARGECARTPGVGDPGTHHRAAVPAAGRRAHRRGKGDPGGDSAARG